MDIKVLGRIWERKVRVPRIGEMLQVNIVHVLCYSKRVSRFVTGGVSLRQLQKHIVSSRLMWRMLYGNISGSWQWEIWFKIEQAVECKLLVPIYLLRELDKDLVSKGIHNKVELWRVFYQVQQRYKAESKLNGKTRWLSRWCRKRRSKDRVVILKRVW